MKRLAVASVVLLVLAGLAVWWNLARETTMETVASAHIDSGDATPNGSQPHRAPGAQSFADTLRQRLSKLPQRPSRGPSAMDRYIEERMNQGPAARWRYKPINEVYAELRAAAEQGDLEAALILGGRSAQCRKVLVDHAPEKMLAELDQELAMENPAPGREGAMMNLRNRFSSDLAEYDACSGVDRASLDEGLAWLERAGRGDVKDARLSYVSTWAEQTRDRDEVIADVERVAAQRTLAHEWLEQGLAAGEDRALDLYIDAYAGQNGLYPRDRVQEMAYRYARDLVRGRRVSEFDALWAKGPIRYGELTSQQWDVAEAQGRALFKTHYEARPVRSSMPGSSPSPKSPQ
ncbi:MAG: hypothetical protein ACREP7_15050 [Lysobacter sp.]